MTPEALANHLWQSTLFALAAGLLALALRRNSAAVRYGVWLAASIKFLIPFSLLIAIGGYWTWAAPAVTPRIPTAIRTFSRPFGPEIQPAGNPIAISNRVVVPASPSSSIRILPFFGAAVWICGILALAGRSWLRFRRVHLTVIQSSALIQGREFEALSRAQRGQKIGSLRLLSSKTQMEPGVCGILHPALLLPTEISNRMSDAELDAVLAHELAHVRRRDNMTAAIHSMVEIVFWFHPLVWWLGSELLRERERACDEATLDSGRDPQVYAEGILKVCNFYLTAPREFVAGVTGSNLRQRMEEIMNYRRRSNLGFGRKLLLGMAGIAAVGGPMLIGFLNAPTLRAQQPGLTTTVPQLVGSLAKLQSPVNSGGGNAAALPGGFFHVNSNLILAADGEAELAGVMAHEISQIAARHPTENSAEGSLLQASAQPVRQSAQGPSSSDAERWPSEVSTIITEEERRAFRAARTEEEREEFIKNFWIRRDPTPGTSQNEIKDEHYSRIIFANEHFGVVSPAMPGSQTDRGKMYILNGPPSEIRSYPSGGSYYRSAQEGGGVMKTFAFEIWRYPHLDGKGDNLVYEFVDFSQNGDYVLQYDPDAKLVPIPGDVNSPR